MQINEKITDFGDLYNHYVIRDGFVFTSICEPADVFDAIVIRCPENAKCFSPGVGVSLRSIDEHIRFINDNCLSKALIIAESIDFLARCPTLTQLEIVPALNTPGCLDMTPLYDHPLVQYLNLPVRVGLNIKGVKEGVRGEIDFSSIRGLEELSFEVSGTEIASNPIHSLKKLSINKYKDSMHKLQGVFDGGNLQNIDFTRCSLITLNFLKNCNKLFDISFNYDRIFSDLSELNPLSNTLKHLSIYNCPKITNIEFISRFINLQTLHLWGSNVIPDLYFTSDLKHLRIFTFDINVLNGDLSPCLNIPYVYSAKDRRHYNLKDSQLPKAEHSS